MNTNDISRSRYLAAAVSAALTFAAAAHAGPQNGVVTNGAATISTPAANLTQIDQTTNSVSIDWQSFDVGANEGVHFNQPSASSVALNRILTQDPSQILGNISANGRVFLLNPNGIIFGSSARVNVGSLVASSLDLTDADAAAGRYSLATAAERSGAIVNDGVITAVSGGSITLLGGSVLNNGLILADYGTVNLGAGRAATLSFDSDGLMRFQIDAGLLTDTNGVSAAVHNSGEISAAGGQVLLTAQQAGDVVAQAVNNEGVIRASRIENVGGVIRLVGSGGTVANSGTLEATGTSTGGTVHVLGERVEIAGTTAIDVSGANGGGTALIGGSYRGADATVLNAQQTSVAAGAIIRADSTTSGDAGQVVLWSDGTTRFHGDISARALGSSGNGGNVEVSGGEHLGIRGHAWLDSANGNSGHLLLDPGALTIVAGDAATTPDYDTDLDTLTDGWVNEQLTSGNLDIVTSASVTPGVTEDLTVAAGADINWTDAGITLRIEGGDSIAINGTINGAGALTLESGGMIALGGNISVGTLDVTAGANITQSSAVAVTGTASFTTAGGSSILLGTTGNAFDGDVTFAASSGTLQNVTLVNSTAIDLQALSIAGNLNVTAGSGSITQSGALSVGGDATFTADAGQSVTLGAANTFTGAVAFVGDGGTLSNVTVRDMSALTLQAMSIDGDLSATAAGLTAQALTVGGDLSLTSSGGISQTGALNVTGNSTFTAGVGQSIALGEANTFNGTVGFVGSGGNLGNVTISDSNELTLQALNITGNLTATAASIASQALTVGGNLDLTATSGGISQTAAMNVTGNSTFTADAGQSITLGQANTFTGAVAFVGDGGTLNNVTVRDTTALTLQPLSIDGDLSATAAGLTAQALTVGGDLSLTSSGGISQTDALNVTGNSTFTAGVGQSIVLGEANTFNGTVGFVGSGGNLGNVTISDSNELTLQALNITGNLTATAASIASQALTVGGNLDLTATSGGISQTAAMNVTGNSTFTADAGQSITLGQANTFTGAVAFVGDGGTLNNVTVRDTTALTLRPLSVAGNLTATAAGITAEALTVGGALNLTASSGDISQTGALNVTGNSTFTAGVGQSIVLGEANTFNGTVSFVGSGGNLDDVTVRDTTNLDLQTLTITGDLVATAATLTQSGALSVAQTSTFRGNQGTNLVLDNSGNALQGAVSFGSNGPGTLQNVTLRNSLTTNLGASTAGGALDVTATSGSITQSGALAIGGASTFTAAVGSSVTLNNAGNSSGGAVSFVGNGGALANVAVTNTTALTLQALSITGDLSATATSIDAQALTVGGDLDLTATTGGISQTAAMNVTGSSTFTADAGESITLGEANTFTGSVSFIGDGGNLDDVTVRDTTALTLQAMSIGGDLTATAAGLTTGAIAVGGNLNLTVSSNDISQMGALNVTGNSTFTANVSQSITLGEANTFTGTVSFVGSGGSLGNVTVRDSNALTLQAMTITGDLSAAGASIVAQALTVGGDLDLTAMTGGISQTGALTVAGNSTFTADAGQSIALGQANTFSGAVSFVGDGGNLDNVTVRDSNALDLQALSIDGDLTATAGSITQSGALTIGGTAAFTAATGQSIALTNAGNDFTGVVTFAGSGGNLANVSVRDSSALTIDALTLNGDLTINAASISQSGALIIGGNSSFTANGGESIALDDTDNAFTGTVGFAARSGTLQDVAITNSSALDLQAMTISGDLTAVGASLTLSGALAVGGTAILTSSAGMALNTTTADALTVNAAGAVTQAGALNISGATTINATGQNVTLTNADNAFDGAIAITAASASLANSGTTTLAASTLATSLTVDSTGAISQTGALNVAGGSTTLTSDAGVALNTINSDTLTVNAGGAVTQSNALTVTGSTTINATGQTVTLDSVTNAFTGSVGINAANATLTNSLATNLAGSTVSNGLTVNSTGSITQSGALGVAGTSTFNAVGQNVTLTNAANALGSVAVTAANASLTSSVATTLLASTLDNDLTVNSTGAITQAGAIDVTAGTATLNSGAGISLHTFDANTLSITAGGAVTQSGTVTVSGATTIAATGQNVTLNDAANAFGGGIAVSGSNVSLGSAGSVDLHASTISGNLAVTSSTGTVSQSGALNVAGNSTFTAADAQSILLTNTANAFGGGVGLTSAGTLDNVSLAAASNLALQGLSISGDLNITAGGALIQTGALTVAGDADFRTLNVGSNIVLTGANQFGSVSATSAGGVSITQGTGDMNLRQISGTGPVRLEASAGSIVDDTVDVAPATVTSNAGVELVALNNIGTVTDLLTRQGTAIAVNTNGGSLAARVTSVNGQVNLGLPSGSAPTAAASAIRAGGSGRLLIQSAGDLSLTASNSAITGFSEIGFSADGILNVPGAQADLISGPLTTFYLRGGADIARTDRTFNLSAGHLVFDSGSQGGDVTLNTSAGRIDASVGGGASFTVQNSGDLVLGTVNAANNLIIRGAHLRDDGDAGTTTRVSAGGAILLDASAGIGEADGVGSGRIDTVASSVTVNAGAGSVYLSHSGDLQISGNAAAGAIDVIAPTGNITVASTLRANGPLTLVAGTAGSITGNITLAGTAQSAGTATLTAANGGVIMDANDAATHLIAQSATLSAASIGSQANTLGVEIGSLNATVNGDVYVNAVNALQLRSIDAATAVINATGAITDDGDNATRVTAQSLNLSGTSIGAASVGGEIDTTTDRLSASASAGGIYVGESGDLQLAALSAAGAGNSIVIRAEGAIMDDGDSATRISGGGLTLTGASIGAPGAAIDTQVGLLNATAAGGVFINEADDLQVNSVSGTDIVLTAGGALTDDGNDATRISGTDIRLSATRIGAADNRIDTAVSSLTTIATAGGIFVAEQDDVALAEVRSSGTGNIVDIRTGGNGNMTVQTLVTQGGTVTLTSGGTGSITVTGGIESNNGVVNLISGNALALPGLDTGTGSVTLRTVNDLNVGTITSSSVSIISDTGNVSLGTINASGGTVTVTANNGTITDGDDTSLTARDATLSARAIGGPDQALNLAVDNLTATATAGGIYINDLGALRLNSINATGVVSIVTTGALTQAAGITSGGSDIEIFAESILMQAGASTLSGNGNISYVANSGTVSLETLDAGTGRALVIAADSVYSTLAPASGIDNLSGSLVEIRAGGLAGTKGEIGTLNAPITITTPTGAGRSVYLIVPAVNGIQTTTPSINYSGSSASLLLKGYTGTTGALLFDLSSTFSPETLLGGSETIVPLANGRVAVNSDSLSAAKQALSSGVISRVNVDWAAFDPNVSLFGTLDPSLRLPADQIDEEELPTASLIPEGTVLTMTRDGWELRRDM